MKHKRNLLALFFIAIAITSLGYILDNDLPYQNWTATAIEFSIITVVIFSAQSAAYGIILGLITFLSRK